jgi:hypothetical protein
MDGVLGVKLAIESKTRMDFERSGVVAFGKSESGHPSQSGTSLRMLVSAKQETYTWLANVSRSQIDIQAIKTHRKENGSSAAMSLF